MTRTPSYRNNHHISEISWWASNEKSVTIFLSFHMFSSYFLFLLRDVLHTNPHFRPLSHKIQRSITIHSDWSILDQIETIRFDLMEALSPKRKWYTALLLPVLSPYHSYPGLISHQPRTETYGDWYVTRAGWKLMKVIWRQMKVTTIFIWLYFLVSDFIFLHYEFYFQKYQLLFILSLTNCAVTRYNWLISEW